MKQQRMRSGRKGSRENKLIMKILTPNSRLASGYGKFDECQMFNTPPASYSQAFYWTEPLQCAAQAIAASRAWRI